MLGNKCKLTDSIVYDNLLSFINNNKEHLLLTNIGEETGEKVEGMTARIIGTQLSTGTTPARIGTYSEFNFKVQVPFDKTMYELVQKRLKKEDKDTSELLDKIRNCELVLLPIKLNDELLINNKTLDHFVVTGIFYKYDLKNKKFVYRIISENPFQSDRDLEVQDYGKTYMLVGNENENIFTSKNKALVKMTDYGYIEPIEISSKKECYVLDNSYLYRIDKGEPTIVGEWLGMNMKLYDKEKVLSSPIVDDLSKVLNIYCDIKNFVMPYKMVSTNKIKL